MARLGRRQIFRPHLPQLSMIFVTSFFQQYDSVAESDSNFVVVLVNLQQYDSARESEFSYLLQSYVSYDSILERESQYFVSAISPAGDSITETDYGYASSITQQYDNAAFVDTVSLSATLQYSDGVFGSDFTRWLTTTTQNYDASSLSDSASVPLTWIIGLGDSITETDSTYSFSNLYQTIGVSDSVILTDSGLVRAFWSQSDSFVLAEIALSGVTITSVQFDSAAGSEIQSVNNTTQQSDSILGRENQKVDNTVPPASGEQFTAKEAYSIRVLNQGNVISIIGMDTTLITGIIGLDTT